MQGFDLTIGDLLKVRVEHVASSTFGVRVVALVSDELDRQRITSLYIAPVVERQVYTLPLPAGRLISVFVAYEDVCMSHEVFVLVELRRDSIGGNPSVVTLLGSWISGGDSASWVVESGVVHPRSKGMPRVHLCDDPLVGQQWLCQHDYPGEWKVIRVHYVLTTSAVAGARRPRVYGYDAAGNVIWSVAGGTVNPSTTSIVDFCDGIPYLGVPTFNMVVPLTQQWISQGFFNGSGVILLDAGDQISQCEIELVPAQSFYG